ncbi:MAG TPA: 2-succinylbenzoate-CoA ligase, partial [Dehalococcoidia bacterium]|nr:2-succinylbenzoate-CoA ligase [Dehalococcoidia bacterium]
YGNFWASASASALNLGLDPSDRWLACLPLNHVGGLSIPIRSAIYGTTVELHSRFEPDAVNRAVRSGDVTLLSVVPTMLRRMLNADDLSFGSSLRAVLVGGGPVAPGLLERATERGLPVVQTYGLTEACSQVTTLAPSEAMSHLGSAGRALLSAEVRVDASVGEAGEILIRGPAVTTGYFRNPEATKAAFSDGWLQTGDIGFFDKDAFLTVLDRRDDVIISGGENVYPAEVEAALLAYPGIEAAAVVGVSDDEWGQRVVAAVVSHLPVELDRVEPLLRSRLAGYKIPVGIERFDALPTTSSGKVQRRFVRQQMAKRLAKLPSKQ